jgi:xanthine dehydrogenase/oxidase
VPALTYKTYGNQPTLPGVVPFPPPKNPDGSLNFNATIIGGADSFVGFTYSAACAVVEVDILTGEVKIISADIVYDMGRSMNPAIDIGQRYGVEVRAAARVSANHDTKLDRGLAS